MNITGTTRLLALFGSPVSHSMSPSMYNYSFKELGIDYVYVAIDTEPSNLKKIIEAAKLYNMRGFNLTMPCKCIALEYMDELSAEARLTRSINTVLIENGKFIGHITDGIGFVESLIEKGISVGGKHFVIVGAGGAATAIIVRLIMDGAEKISIFNRKGASYDSLQTLRERLKRELKTVNIEIYDLLDEKSFAKEVAAADVLVNATPLGMEQYREQTIVKNLSLFHTNLVVADLIYNPTKTLLLREAASMGCKTVDGRGMLLHQGAAAFRLFTGENMPIDRVRDRFFR